MDEYKVSSRYDVWTGVWHVAQSSVPGLQVEASTVDEFEKTVNRICAERSGERAHRTVVVSTTRVLVSFPFPFSNRAFVNGRLVTREQLSTIRARYEAAG